MDNYLYLIVPSNLLNPSDFIRLAQSVDVSRNIYIQFINQNPTVSLSDIFHFEYCHVNEIRTWKTVPLSVARNIALEDLFKKNFSFIDNTMIMFVDDDAWFPIETIEMLLHEPVSARCLRTIDPDKNKSFNGLSYQGGIVKGWHVIHDIPSICFVAPFAYVYKLKYLFNEKLGLGCEISQGEESLYIYNLFKNGLEIHYDSHYIYHPYKVDKNPKNKYSMSYFWSLGLFHISPVFLWPAIKYVIKYTVAIVLIFKDKKYFELFLNVWKGFFDGIRDSKKVLNNG